MSEQVLTRAIIQALGKLGVWCWRVNSGMIPIRDTKYGKRMVVLAPPGTPDILGVLPGGRLFGLEVKTKTGRQSDSQREWQAMAEQHGVHYRVVRSVGEAVDAVREWSR